MCSTGEISGGAGLLDVLEQAATQLRAAAGMPLGGAVSDVQLTQAMQRLEAIGRIATGHKLTVVAEIDKRHAYLGARARSTEDLLATTLHISPGEAKAQADLATKLEVLPETAAALRDGRVGVGQVAETAKKADELKDREGGAELIAALDAHAASYGQLVDRGRLGRELDRFTEQAGAGVLADREQRAQAKRGVWFTQTPDGLPTIRATMSVLGQAHVRAVLDALGKPDGANDERNVAQRHHDALVTLAERYLDDGELPTVAAQRPHVLLITTAESLHGQDGADPSLLDGYGPVSTDLARQVCCDADVTRVEMVGAPTPTLGGKAFEHSRRRRCPHKLKSGPRLAASAQRLFRRAKRRGPLAPHRVAQQPRADRRRQPHPRLLVLPHQNPSSGLARRPRPRRPLPRRPPQHRTRLRPAP